MSIYRLGGYTNGVFTREDNVKEEKIRNACDRFLGELYRLGIQTGDSVEFYITANEAHYRVGLGIETEQVCVQKLADGDVPLYLQERE